jgi:hypothetical protein
MVTLHVGKNLMLDLNSGLVGELRPDYLISWDYLMSYVT